jgi:zinc resistance-associated protein
VWKTIVVVAAMLALAGISAVYAQQRSDSGDGDFGRGYRHQRMSAEDIAAFTDAHIAALRAGLELTPDQAKNWPPFEQALRDMAELRAQRRKAYEERAQNPTNEAPFERLARRADNMSKASAALKRIADTGAPLYQSLGDAQRARFVRLARILRPHPPMHAFDDDGRRGGYGWRRGTGYEHHNERGSEE